MPSSASGTEVFTFRPLTLDEFDVLATISDTSLMLGAAAFLIVIGAASVVALKTKLPGRRSVLLSALLLPVWWVLERGNGISLESTFGPEAVLVSYTVHSAIAVLFAVGYVRMSLAFVRERAAAS